MTTLYRSTDDGALYLRSQIDDPSNFEHIEVPDVITLTPEQLPGNNDITELLLRSGQAKIVRRGP